MNQRKQDNHFMRDRGTKAVILQYISFLKKDFLEFIRDGFAENSQFLLCFVCSLGTAIGLGLSAMSFIWENASLDLAYFGLFISSISFGVFLYVAWKMD
jgi:hypothetical protein